MKTILDKNPDLDFTQGICVRRTLWEESVRKCHGQMKRYICNFALNDLPEAMEKNCLFLNKFDLEVDPSAATCMYQHWINTAKSKDDFYNN